MRRWDIRLAARAEQDLTAILRWTSEQFGPGQARAYRATLLAALEALRSGPDVIGARRRDELGDGVRTLHVARAGRRGRHFVVFRPAEPQRIDVLRVLHDSMDLPRHLPIEDDLSKP